MIFALRVLGAMVLASASTAAPDGAKLFAAHCAACHDHPQGHMPTRESLGRRSAANIVMTLKTGAMQPQAAGLSTDADRAIATFLTAEFASHQPKLHPNICRKPAAPLHPAATGDWNGWGVDLANTRFQPTPGLAAADVPRLKVQWAFAYPGATTWGQPTVVSGRVFVANTIGQVYALDAGTGCTLWTAAVGAPVRTAISIAPGAGAHPVVAYFGDTAANVHAVDAATGAEIWRTHVDEHPMARVTGTPVAWGHRILVPVSSFEEGAASTAGYACCTFRGSVVALDADTGKLIWKRRTIAQQPQPYRRRGTGENLFGPAGASVWGAPTVDAKRGLLYVGTGNDYTDVSSNMTDAVVAIDVASGAIRWSKQLVGDDNWESGCSFAGPCPQPAGTDADISASPILVELPSGRAAIVVGQKSGVVFGLDPAERGKVLWRSVVGGGGVFGGVEWGMAASGTTVFVPISDSLTNTTNAAKPGLGAIEAATGKQLWWAAAPTPTCTWGPNDCRASISQAASAMPGIVLSGSQDGHLRAHDEHSGKVVWDFDTGHAFPAVNANSAEGGSLDAGGPAIANGMVYVNSGYGQFLGRGGNVLLALGLNGK